MTQQGSLQALQLCNDCTELQATHTFLDAYCAALADMQPPLGLLVGCIKPADNVGVTLIRGGAAWGQVEAATPAEALQIVIDNQQEQKPSTASLVPKPEIDDDATIQLLSAARLAAAMLGRMICSLGVQLLSDGLQVCLDSSPQITT